MSDAAPSSKRRLSRNPWLWATLLGIGFLTVIRPFMRHIPDPPPVVGEVPDFHLLDQNGKPFQRADLDGHVWVLSFFFTSCVTLCPKVMKAMHTLQDKAAAHHIPLRLLSITVDPDNDRPEQLRAYATRIGADLERWTFLTGEWSTIRGLVVGGLKEPMGRREATDDDAFDITHSGRLLIIDPRGRLRGGPYEHDEMGVDEVFHRSQHVLQEARGGGGCSTIGALASPPKLRYGRGR